MAKDMKVVLSNSKSQWEAAGKKSIYFCTYSFQHCENEPSYDSYYRYYVINPNKKKTRNKKERNHEIRKKTTAEKLVPVYERNYFSEYDCATINSRIYIVGDDCVYILDPTKSTWAWEEGPSMIFGMGYPTVVAANGMIYAFGTIKGAVNHYPNMELEEEEPFAQVYDPFLKKWEALEGRPNYDFGESDRYYRESNSYDFGGSNWYNALGHAVDEDRKTIILNLGEGRGSAKGGLCLYKWEEKTWEQFPICLNWEGTGVVLDGILYFRRGGRWPCLNAWNLAAAAAAGSYHNPLVSTVLGLEVPGVLPEHPWIEELDWHTQKVVRLFQAGEKKLGLLWSDPNGNDEVRIHCTLFKIHIEEPGPDEETSYRAVVEFHEVYVAEGELNHCWTL